MVFKCSPWVETQQEAQLEALIRGVRLCERVGWSVFHVMGYRGSGGGSLLPLLPGGTQIKPSPSSS